MPIALFGITSKDLRAGFMLRKGSISEQMCVLLFLSGWLLMLLLFLVLLMVVLLMLLLPFLLCFLVQVADYLVTSFLLRRYLG